MTPIEEWFSVIRQDCGKFVTIIGSRLYKGKYQHELRVYENTGRQIATYRLKDVPLNPLGIIADGFNILN